MYHTIPPSSILILLAYLELINSKNGEAGTFVNSGTQMSCGSFSCPGNMRAGEVRFC